MAISMLRGAGIGYLLLSGIIAQASHPTWLTNVSGLTLHLVDGPWPDAPLNLTVTQQKDGKAVTTDLTKGCDITIPNNSTVSIDQKEGSGKGEGFTIEAHGIFLLIDDHGASVIGKGILTYKKYNWKDEPELDLSYSDGEMKVSIIKSTTGVCRFMTFTPKAK